MHHTAADNMTAFAFVTAPPRRGQYQESRNQLGPKRFIIWNMGIHVLVRTAHLEHAPSVAPFFALRRASDLASKAGFCPNAVDSLAQGTVPDAERGEVFHEVNTSFPNLQSPLIHPRHEVAL